MIMCKFFQIYFTRDYIPVSCKQKRLLIFRKFCINFLSLPVNDNFMVGLLRIFGQITQMIKICFQTFEISIRLNFLYRFINIMEYFKFNARWKKNFKFCLLYTSDAADE